jgi:hypothetical protein
VDQVAIALPGRHEVHLIHPAGGAARSFTPRTVTSSMIGEEQRC